MKKWLYVEIGAIVVIIAIIIFGLSNLGPIIKKAVNSYGPKITKTELHVDDVGVSIFSAEAKIKNFFLGNPSGFKTPSAMEVGSVLVDVDEKSLSNNTIVIDRIEVIRPEITYEKKGRTDIATHGRFEHPKFDNHLNRGNSLFCMTIIGCYNMQYLFSETGCLGFQWMRLLPVMIFPFVGNTAGQWQPVICP